MSLHHTLTSPCPLCEAKKTEAHPFIAEWFEKVKAEFPDAHLSWTYRDEENQNRAFQEGKSRLKYPHSAHNVTVSGLPRSRAMDLFRLRPDQVAEFRRDWFQSIAKWLESEKAPLFWGAAFKSLGDFDHFQVNQEIV